MLRHQVRQVVRAEDLGQLNKLADLLLLKPGHAHVEVPDSPDALSLQDSQRNSRVDVKPRAQLNAEVIRERYCADGHARCFCDRKEVRLRRALRDRSLCVAL